MRKYVFTTGEFYHIYSHSIGDLVLFRSNRDHERFLSTLFSANGKRDIAHLERFPGLNLVWDIRDGKVALGDNFVDIIGFCLMPTHFHLILQEKSDGNISYFMHRALVSYAKYFNLKYERRGHVFERTFNAKHLSDTDYLMRALAYVHLNPKGLNDWKKREHKYQWSSFQDYISENRWGKLLATGFALEYCDNDKKEYFKFVKGARSDDEYVPN